MKHLERSSRRQLLRMGAALGGGYSRRSGRTLLAWDTPGNWATPLGPLRRAIAVREGRPLAPRLEDAGDGFQFHAAAGRPSARSRRRLCTTNGITRGYPTIDPSQHRLVIHGMVDRPLSLSMAEIQRLPSVTRTLVLECGGNSAGEWAATDGARRPAQLRSRQLQRVDRRSARPRCSREVGVSPGAAWVIAEGADACRMERSIPLVEGDGEHPARVRAERRSDSSRRRAIRCGSSTPAGKATRT